MYEELTPAYRRKALKGAFSAIATKLRKEAVGNMRSATASKKTGPSGFASNRFVERGIRKVMYKRSLGFRITVGTKKRKVDYSGLDEKGRKAKSKQERESAIVALWAEGGTVGRNTRKTRTKRGIRGRGHATGFMPSFRFMEKTKSIGFKEANRILEEEIIKSLEKTVTKYGSTIR